MFARFGPQARRVIALAEDHARALWRSAVGPDHLLLALLAVDDRGTFVRVGLHFDDVRSGLAESASAASRGSTGAREAAHARHLPMRLRSIFRDAFRHAALLGSPEVTPLHLALALVEDPPGEVAIVLRRVGIEAEAVRDALRAEIVDVQVEAGGQGATNVLRLPVEDREAAMTRRQLSAAT